MVTRPRCGSPPTRGSILITSAPHSASTAPAAGTNVHTAASKTRIPSSGFAIEYPPLLFRTRPASLVEYYLRRFDSVRRLTDRDCAHGHLSTESRTLFAVSAPSAQTRRLTGQLPEPARLLVVDGLGAVPHERRPSGIEPGHRFVAVCGLCCGGAKVSSGVDAADHRVVSTDRLGQLRQFAVGVVRTAVFRRLKVAGEQAGVEVG